MKVFDKMPKSIKKTIRYIHQDVNSLEKLVEIERELMLHMNKRKEMLKGDT
ncbi:LytR family transcriptional regulator [Evansella sp. AB-P1]|uniref:LytR family transcriptional regulator n=1 Tax=Evansella sp. AB-P1 TaxID=3037653 RepID=UPI00241FBA65|nr:LytR family transcriptional regulator [Evansella sp. AB-P1]MDG5789297.1 LytR family transcriptional regulator [Evansella sp. AB-P1]